MSISAIIISVVSMFALVIFAATYKVNTGWTAGAWIKTASVIMIGVGYAVIVSESSDINQFLAMRHWPTVQAKIVSSQVEGQRAFHPDIVYEYMIGDTTYTGSTDMGVPGFGTKANRLNVAETSVAQNPVGKIITVHYNPQNPSFSKLRIVPTYTAFLLLSVASMLLGAGLWGALSTFFKKKH